MTRCAQQSAKLLSPGIAVAEGDACDAQEITMLMSDASEDTFEMIGCVLRNWHDSGSLLDYSVNFIAW